MPDEIAVHTEEIPRPIWLKRFDEQHQSVTDEMAVSETAVLQTWLNYKSPHFARNAYKWDYIADFLNGTVENADRIQRYVMQRPQGESLDAYKERLCITDYTPDFYRAVSSLGSMLFQLKDAVTRSFERDGRKSVLGNPSDPDTQIHKWWNDVDGMGTNYLSFLKHLANNLIAYGECWIGIDGGGGGKPPQISLLAPQHVLRDVYADGRLESVKTLTYVDRADPDQMSKPKIEGVYTIARREGYEIWHHVDGKESEITSGVQPYGQKGKRFVYSNRRGETVPPLFRVTLPIGNVGYSMAKKACVLLNHQSTANFMMRSGGFPRFLVDAYSKDGGLDEKHWKLIERLAKAGSRVWPGASGKFVSPSMTNAQILCDLVDKRRQEFFQTFFQAYGDRASEKTATEIKQDFSTSTQAFLSMLATSIEEAENEIFFRLEQAWGGDRSKVGIANVEWTRDFSSMMDPVERVNHLVNRAMPNGEVIGDVETLLRLTTEYWASYGYDVSGDEAQKAIKARIEESLARQNQQTSAFGTFI